MDLRAEASGAIVADDLVVTNRHVVEGATTIVVKFADGTSVDADVLGTDGTHDLAVLAVPTGDRSAMEIGSSPALELGEGVVALGYPPDLGIRRPRASRPGSTARSTCRARPASNTSRGYCSGRGDQQRELRRAADRPLRRLVGTNTAAASAASTENIGFAVSIDEAWPAIVSLAGTELPPAA